MRKPFWIIVSVFILVLIVGNISSKNDSGENRSDEGNSQCQHSFELVEGKVTCTLGDNCTYKCTI